MNRYQKKMKRKRKRKNPALCIKVSSQGIVEFHDQNQEAFGKSLRTNEI
jgi:hypothetical protein